MKPINFIVKVTRSMRDGNNSITEFYACNKVEVENSALKHTTVRLLSIDGTHETRWFHNYALENEEDVEFFKRAEASLDRETSPDNCFRELVIENMNGATVHRYIGYRPDHFPVGVLQG